MAIQIETPPIVGDTIDINGVTYLRTSEDVYVSTAKEYKLDDPDKYVLKVGDNMTGSLKAPRFVANYSLDTLRDLP